MKLEELLLAVEYGYKGCEKGWNVQRTLEEFSKIYFGDNHGKSNDEVEGRTKRG